MNLLTTNTKLSKSTPIPAIVRGLTLLPHRSSGRNLCAYASSCADCCVLELVGMSRMPSVRDARRRKTDFFFSDRAGFLKKLSAELDALSRQCDRAGLRGLVRLNTGSDLPWERIAPSLFDRNLTFYDYTKYPLHRRGLLPENYHLTYSVSEDSSDSQILEYLESGMNVAIVWDGVYKPAQGILEPIPEELQIGKKWFPTVDGDVHDARIPELDGRGRVVLIRFKGSAAAKQNSLETGFTWHLEW